MTDSERTTAGVPILNQTNYDKWKPLMLAYLGTKSLRWTIDSTHVKPVAADTATPTAIERREQRDWDADRQKAAGIIYMAVHEDIRIDIDEDHDKSDPATMWKTLAKRGAQSKPADRFSALGNIVALQQEPDESLLVYHARCKNAVAEWAGLLPAKYDLDNLKSELACWCTLRGLSDEYSAFSSNIVNGLEFSGKTLDMEALRSAFSNEASQRHGRQGPAAAMRATPAASGTSTPLSTTSTAVDEDAVLKAFAAAGRHTRCWMCDSPEHLVYECPRRNTYREKASNDRKAGNKKGKSKKDKPAQNESNAQTHAHAASSTPATPAPAGQQKSALAAAVRSLNVSSDNRLPLSALSAQGSRAAADWNTDTGCSTHMTHQCSYFRSYSPHRQPIFLADDSVIFSEGIGSVEFKPQVDEVEGVDGTVIVFHDVLHVPKLAVNLLSVFDLTRNKGYTVLAQGDTVGFFHSGRLACTATVGPANTGYLNGTTLTHDPVLANAASTRPMDFELWHQRFSHINHRDLRAMHKNAAVDGMRLDSKAAPDPVCEPCLAGKQHRHAVPKGPAKRTTALGELIHMDLKGPLPRSHAGFRYNMVFVEDHSRHRVDIPLRRKSEAFAAFLIYKAWFEKQTGCKIKKTRDDKGGEFISNAWEEFCKREGIERQHTETNEPHQNGVAERANRDGIEHATALLNQAKLPAIFWVEALNAHTHTRNRSVTSTLDPSLTPYTVLKGKKPDVHYFRAFGCLAYVLLLKSKRGAFDDHSRKCIFVGYPQGKKAWRFWDPDGRVFVESSQASFDERCFPGNSPTAIRSLSDAVLDGDDQDSGGEAVAVLDGNGDDGEGDAFWDNLEADAIAQLDPYVAPAPAPANPVVPAEQPAEDAAPRRNAQRDGRPTAGTLREPDLRRTSQYPTSHSAGSTATFRTVNSDGSSTSCDDVDEFASAEELSAAVDAGLEFMLDCGPYLEYDEALDFALLSTRAMKATSLDNEPRTFREAMLRPPEERSRWLIAAHEELNTLLRNETFEMVLLPEGRKAIGSRWVFKVKRNADGSVERYKARLVAQGFSQRPGFDYSETFAPTPKWARIRAVLAIAAFEDLELDSVDISSAFLNGELTEEVYMKLPEGFQVRGPEWVLKLLRSLYGLKQASRIWHETLNKALTEMGFERVLCDTSVWVYSRADARIIVPVFVDDMTIATGSKEASARVRKELGARFKLRDLGPTKWLLGVEVMRDRGNRVISLSQRQYALDVLRRFGMQDCNPVTTPMDTNVKLSVKMAPQTDADREFMASVPYLSAVGSLAYLAVATRPDIAYSVGVLARFSANPGPEHWKACKHLLRYVAGTVDQRLVYAPPSCPNPELFYAYSDADHAGNPDNGRSTSGMVVKMGSGAISWHSHLQPFVTLSTTEAEYVAACATGQEVLWLRNLLTAFGYRLTQSSPLGIDNMSHRRQDSTHLF